MTKVNAGPLGSSNRPLTPTPHLYMKVKAELASVPVVSGVTGLREPSIQPLSGIIYDFVDPQTLLLLSRRHTEIAQMKSGVGTGTEVYACMRV